jgi:CheY-like chemotaxis protein
VSDILALVDDIFFQAKMLETAKHLGVEMKSFATGDALLLEIESHPPKLIVVDLNARQSPLDAISALRQRNQNIPIVAFLSHVQTELASRARDAGCTEVMPRSKFTKELAVIFSRAKS